MVDPGLVRRRLDALLRFVGLARPLGEADRATFRAEPAQHHLAERYLHLAVEAALDVAHHIIADGGYEAPETYRSAFEILERHGVVDHDLSLRLQAWAGFRNVLVHGYLEVDHDIVFDALRDDLVDLEAFAAVAARLLGE